MNGNLNDISTAVDKDVVSVTKAVSFADYGGSIVSSEFGISDSRKYSWFATTLDNDWYHVPFISVISEGSVSLKCWEFSGTPTTPSGFKLVYSGGVPIMVTGVKK